MITLVFSLSMIIFQFPFLRRHISWILDLRAHVPIRTASQKTMVEYGGFGTQNN